MLDGIDHITLLGPDVDELLRLYRDHLGFTPETRTRVTDPQSHYHELWKLPHGPLDIHTLTKPGSTGGGLRLVGAPALTSPGGPRSMRTPGPFAIDFYVRDLEGLHAEMGRDGYRFRSELVSYELFGTGFTVDEVLLEAPLGFVHAFVQFLPGQHRCVLGTSPREQVSEVVAAITLVDDVDEGLETLAGALEGQVYFDEVFRGEAIEELLGLPRGSEFRTVLLRGPARRNARAELMATVPDAPVQLDRTHPHLVLSVQVPDLDAVLERLDGAHAVVGPFELEDGPHTGRRVATVWTTWGAVLEFVEGDQ